MMSGLEDLYQEVIVDHSRKPRNFGPLEAANARAEGYNPLCGDKVTVQLRMEDDRVAGIAFQGAGCAISTASASLMTESVKGKSRAEVEKLFDTFHELLTGPYAKGAELGKLAVFSGDREFPTRVKCATLAWHTLRAALDSGAQGETARVSTE